MAAMFGQKKNARSTSGQKKHDLGMVRKSIKLLLFVFRIGLFLLHLFFALKLSFSDIICCKLVFYIYHCFVYILFVVNNEFNSFKI